MTTNIKTSNKQQQMNNNNNNNNDNQSSSSSRRREAAAAPVRITTSDDERSSSGGCSSEGGKVSFGEVRIRCHERVLNHRVSGKFAGLELGWGHNTSIRHNLEDYEQLKTEQRQRETRNSSSSSTTDAKSSKAIPRRFTVLERLHKLSKYGYPSKEILALERLKRKAKREAAAIRIRRAAAELEEDEEDSPTKCFNICWGNRKRKQMRESGCFANKKLMTLKQKIRKQLHCECKKAIAMRM